MWSWCRAINLGEFLKEAGSLSASSCQLVIIPHLGSFTLVLSLSPTPPPHSLLVVAWGWCNFQTKQTCLFLSLPCSTSVSVLVEANIISLTDFVKFYLFSFLFLKTYETMSNEFWQKTAANKFRRGPPEEWAGCHMRLKRTVSVLQLQLWVFTWKAH